MKVDIYKKTAKDFRFPPNLDDYQETRKHFEWKAAKKELSWLDGNINAAYNAIDRHTQTWRKNKVALYWEDESGASAKYTFWDIQREANRLSR